MKGLGAAWRGAVSPRGLRWLRLAAEAPSALPDARRDDDHPAAAELRGYFAGTLDHFTVPVDLDGQPPFRKKVLRALAAIPAGRTTTYGALAAACGSPRGARAAGQAVGHNPVPVVLPCHRVLATGGGLGGFGLGLPMKERLLAHDAGFVGAGFVGAVATGRGVRGSRSAP